MWIRDIDFPEALIEAARAKRLVIFVGAGASRDEPANLPDFRTLASDIAGEANIEIAEHELKEPDVLLGRVADRGVDVHRRVVARIGAPTSRPNLLHEAIVDLARAAGSVRIVTTNYDLHLATAMTTRGLEVIEYMAPALPMGDDFTGLVYLHGSVSQEPRHLVVTDSDFGRAYLRDAWAARFLERMFASFTVLFVGYSHTDVVMRYLARSLGPESKRYALTPDPGASDWRQLDVRAVGYQVASGSHAALADAIAGWARLLSMGLLDHRQRLGQLVSVPPSEVPEEASYLEAAVADADTVKVFTELARGEAWLVWATAQPQFRRLFDPAKETSDCALALAYWFVEHFVMVEELTEVALRTARESGGRITPALWNAIGFQLHARETPRADWLEPWIVLLIENSPEGAQDWLEYALVASSWPGDRDVALLLFDHLTEPHAVIESSYGLGGAPRFDVRKRGDDYWLGEAWLKLFTPNLREAALPLIAIVDRHLRRAHQLLVSAGSASPGWDPVSFSRSSIRPHSQDQHRDDMDILIDAARDCIESLLADDGDLALSYVRTWGDSHVPILRRLAVHAWVKRSDVDGSAKLRWLREKGWLFDHQLRHEVFELVATALASSDGQAVDALVADADGGPSDIDDEDVIAYERFNLLVWITMHAPAFDGPRLVLERVQSEHPDFQVRNYPDLLSWSEAGAIGPKPPMSVAELHERITNDVQAALAELRRYEHVQSLMDGPTWHDAISLVTDTVRDYPEDGFAILAVASEEELEFTRATIRGWSYATLSDDTAEAALERLTQIPLASAADDLARLLSDSGSADAVRTEWHRFESARRLADNLWQALNTSAAPTEVADWLGLAINTPAGHLAQFWLHAIADDWRSAGAGWTGLSAETRVPLESLLGGQDDRAAMAQVIFASQVHFFFGADRAWCEAHVLPLFDWSDPTRAQRAWDGFLMWGRWSDQLLAAGLLKGYLQAVLNVDEFRRELRRRLAEHLAAVALYGDIEPLTWIMRFTATIDVAGRVEWMNQVAWMLDRLSDDAVERQWHRWMQEYWRGRLDSVPLMLTVEEASAMAEWVIYLTSSAQTGVDLATANPARLGEHGDVLHKMEKRIDEAPTAFAKLLGHLLASTQPPFWGCHHLATIVPQLRPHTEDLQLRVIIEEALRLGCSDAVHW